MPKQVLLLATTTGYQIRSFGDAAERLGVRLVCASDRCDQLEDPWWDGAIPVRFHDNQGSVQTVLEACSHTPPDGIIAVGDRPVTLAAHLAAALRLEGHPPEAVEATRNKFAFRTALKAASLPTPWFEQLPLATDAAERARSLPYPVVLKPLALSGSRGVIRVDDAAQFVAAFERVRCILESPDVRVERDAAHEMAIVEGFVPGREFAVEGLLDRGVLRVLAIFDKPDPLDGPFFEETIYVTPSRVPAAVQARLVEAVEAAVRCLGLHHGPIHAECRMTPGSTAELDASTETYVLEVAARPIGGLCSSALRFSGGGTMASLEELLLRHALGEDVAAFEREADASGVMMIPIPRRGVYRGVQGVDRARAVPGIEAVAITAKEHALLVPLPEGRSYLGFIFARGAEPAVVERALRQAYTRIEFSIEREVALAAGGG